MVFYLKFGLVVVALLTEVHCEQSLFPVGQELIYKWKVNVTTGTVLPSNFLTSWAIESTVRIQQQTDNQTLIQIDDIKLGEEEYLRSDDISSLSLPFQVTYSNGDLIDLVVSEEDLIWSQNLKRALSGALQLKLDSISLPSFVAEEVNHLGKCTVEYERLKSEEGGLLKLRKTIDQDSCVNLPFVHFSNCLVSMCPGNYQNIAASDSEREYTLTTGEDIIIRKMAATGRILVQPYQANAESHYSKICQSFDLVSINDIPSIKEIKLSEDSASINLIYEIVKLDPTYGKKPKNNTTVVDQVFKQLGELSDSLSSWEVGVKGLDNETSFHALDLMWWMKVDDWESLHNAISLGTSYRQETIQNLFWDLLPHVGSRSAILFIKKLVTSNRIKGFLAGRMLASIPFHLREYSEKLLEECEDFMTLNDGVTKDVKNYAILSFASMISKICKTECKTDTIDRYAKLYLDKFTESSTFEDKMVYLQGLSNMELTQVLDFLSPVITGQTKNTHIRFLAIWATQNAIITSPIKMYEVYWPIFVNKTEPLDIRVAALTLLMLSKPTISRLFSIYLHMQEEPSEQLYNFYYTTIQSLAKTNYPCYKQLGDVAARFARFVPARSRHWATGNYLLDFEDSERAYGGIFQTILIASEQTGLPNVFMFLAEQHSLGHSRNYALYLKTEGLPAAYNNQFQKLVKLDKSNLQIPKVLELLRQLNVSMMGHENVHFEVLLKIDGKTVLIYYLNDDSFTKWTGTVHRLSSLYMEFSVNYQSLGFPLIISTTKPTDLGTPALIKIRAASLMSTRGSISQEKEGKVRNAELDFRYSWNGVTTLRDYSPFTNKWYGADRCRNIHIRLPFTTQLIIKSEKEKSVKIKAVRHREFVTGTRLGMVWHASTRYVSKNPVLKEYKNVTDRWNMDSEDLGVGLGASVFDCSHPDTLPDALNLLKKAFLANNKNYNMIPGGVVILGLLALKDQLQFQPQGVSCGLMLYFTPKQPEVEPELHIDGSGNWELKMKRPDGLLWEIQAGTKRSGDDDKEFVFKLYRAPSVKQVENRWRVIQLEGAFIVPSRMSGVSERTASLTGYSFMSWGDASPTHSDNAGMIDLKLIPRHNDISNKHCNRYTPDCLQAASDQAAKQTAVLQYNNLPIWLKTAAHALFPEEFQTESSRTQISFAYPVAYLPWNTNGLCAVNSGSVLTLDNATIPFNLSNCYTLAVADCSLGARFSIEVRKVNNLMAAKVIGDGDIVELLSHNNDSTYANVNGIKVNNIKQGYEEIGSNRTQLSVRERSEGVIEVELNSGVKLYVYNTTVVILVPAMFRGTTCGLCGDFNSDTINEPVSVYTSCISKAPDNQKSPS